MKNKFMIYMCMVGLPFYMATVDTCLAANQKVTQVPLGARDIEKATANIFLLFDNSDSMRYQHLPQSNACAWDTTYNKHTDLYRTTSPRCADAKYNLSHYSGYKKLDEKGNPILDGDGNEVWEIDYPTPVNHKLEEVEGADGASIIQGVSLGDSDYKNAWRQGYWRVIHDDPYNSRDKHVQDLRLARPYSSGADTYNNAATGNSGYGGTDYYGAYTVYLSATRGSRTTGEVGQYVQCHRSKDRTAKNNTLYPGWEPDDKTVSPTTVGRIYAECSTRLPGTYDYETIMNSTHYSTALENGSRAWFSKDADTVAMTHTKGFICQNRQKVFPSRQTKSARYPAGDLPEGTFYSLCIELEGDEGKTVTGYKLPDTIYTNDLPPGTASRSEVFLSIWPAVGDYNNSNGGKYRNGFVCKNRFGTSYYTYSDCDIAPGNALIAGYRIAEGFTYMQAKSGKSHGSTTTADFDKIYVRDPDEWQRVANWFSYYRYRMHMARAAFSFAFAKFPDNYYIAWDDINNSSSVTQTVSGRSGSVPKFVSGNGQAGGLKHFGDSKTNLYEWVFELNPLGVTPLRNSLARVGSFLMYSNEPWTLDPTKPTDMTNPLLSCRNNYAVMMTDGSWNSTAAPAVVTYLEDSTDAVANPAGGHRDNAHAWGGLIESDSTGETFLFKAEYPYKHTQMKSESIQGTQTLADVAMYYWRRDLRPDMANDVPDGTIMSGNADFAFWQHLNSSFLGLGISAGEDRASGEPAFTEEDVYKAIESKTKIHWADPGTDRGKVDDLLHAAINGRGAYASGNDAASFSSAFEGVITSIQSVTTSGTHLGTNLQAGVSALESELVDSRFIYQASYQSYLWTGSLAKYTVEETKNSMTGKIEAKLNRTPLNASIPEHTQRNIVTYTKDGRVVPFVWGELSDAQRLALTTEHMLNYIRGDGSLEISNGGTYRNRQSKLGDIVNSSPIYVGVPDPSLYAGYSYTEAALHKQFAEDRANRRKMVYAGANDGMLHGFDADTMVETFAYVPGVLVNANLKDLASPDYNQMHRYYVDGEITVQDAYVNGAWRTILVGTLGRGGKSVYAVDVTDPDNPKVMWEVGADQGFYGTRTTDTMFRMGYYTGKVSIVRWQGQWVAILGNGYDNGSCVHGDDPILLILDLATGEPAITPDLFLSQDGSCPYPNGFSSPLVLDLNNDGNADWAYVGDYRGNLVRVDLKDLSSTGRRVRPTRTYLFTGPDSRPITSMPLALVRDNGELWIYFGTGRWLLNTDPADNTVQTWYGIRDTGSIATEQQLTEIKIVEEQSLGEKKKRRRLEVQEAPRNSRGWFMRLKSPSGAANGERMVIQNEYRAGILMGYSLIPMAGSACSASTDGYTYSLDPYTGQPKSLFSVDDKEGWGAVSTGTTPIGSVATGGGTLILGGEGVLEAGTPDTPPYVQQGEAARKAWRGLGETQ